MGCQQIRNLELWSCSTFVLCTWDCNPVTAGSALATAFERFAVQLTVDDVLEAPQQHAEEEWGRE